MLSFLGIGVYWWGAMVATVVTMASVLISFKAILKHLKARMHTRKEHHLFINYTIRLVGESRLFLFSIVPP